MNFQRVASVCAIAFWLNGCFFFVIPGSVTGKISDAVTGAKGANCVGTNAAVGDSVRMGDGSAGRIKSLSGKSGRCNDPSLPIRAEIERIPTPPAFRPSAHLTPQSGWALSPLPAGGSPDWRDYMTNPTTSCYAAIASASHAGISDLAAFTETRRTIMRNELAESSASDIVPVTAAGHPAMRFTVSGKLKSGPAIARVVTVVDGATEIVIVNAWTVTPNFDAQRTALAQIADQVSGL